MRVLLRAAATIGFLAALAGTVSAQSVSEGFYARGEFGGAMHAADEGYWWGPGGPPGDPRITFSLNHPLGFTGAAGLGYDFGTGVRVDTSVNFISGMQVDGEFQSASFDTQTGHASDIHAPVSVLALMGNVFIEPMRLTGSDSAFQPFLTGGIGIAAVSTGQWTRNNPTLPARPTRSWDGGTEANFAWTLGGGISVALENDSGGEKGFLDLTYRYSDFGQARGGTSPVDPPPSNSPTKPFNFPMGTHAVTVGFRMPLGY